MSGVAHKDESRGTPDLAGFLSRSLSSGFVSCRPAQGAVFKNILTVKYRGSTPFVQAPAINIFQPWEF